MSELINDTEVIERYRQTHHAIATYFALGYTASRISQMTGKSKRSLTLIYNNPLFQELIAQKLKTIVEDGEEATRKQAELDFSARELMTRNHITAEQMIAEKLEQAELSGELPSFRDLNIITSDRADRLGYSKHTQVTHTHDFSAQLDRAISRSNRQKQIQTIEGEVLSVPDFSKEPAALSPVSTQPQAPQVAPEPALNPKAQRPQVPGRPSFVDALKRKFA